MSIHHSSRARLHAIGVAGALSVLAACADPAPLSSPPAPVLLPTATEVARATADTAAPTSAVVSIIPNLAYASRSPSEALDLYLPGTGTKPYPVVLYIHGGAWMNGSRKLPPNAPHFALLNAGIAFASMDHRTSGEAHYPAQIHDAKAAIRWLRANAAKYGLDSSRIGTWGMSSGGHLASLLGSSNGIGQLTDLSLGNPGMSERVKSVVTMFAPVDFLLLDSENRQNGCPPFGGTGFNAASSPTSLLMGAPIQTVPSKVKTANPATFVTAGDAAFLIQHGTADCSIPWQQSGILSAKATAVLGASRVTLQYFQGAGHAAPAFTSPANAAKVVQFFKTTL